MNSDLFFGILIGIGLFLLIKFIFWVEMTISLIRENKLPKSILYKNERLLKSIKKK